MYTAPNELTEIARFSNWGEFQEAEHKLKQLVKQVKLSERGLDPLEPTAFVQVYKTQDGETWRLTVPDHTFRGYLKRTSPEDERRVLGITTIRPADFHAARKPLHCIRIPGCWLRS